MSKTKCYPHVTGIYGDQGENPSALAIHAVLDPSPNYPENGRIIVGSPATTPTIPGYIPNLGGFNGGPAAIERLASTLLDAARDVRAAMGTGERKPSAADQPTIESTFRYAETWLKSESGDRMTLEQFEATCFASALQRLEPVLKAVIAFVDQQGKRVDVDRGHTIGLPEDFAATEFADLVRAVEGAGR